MLVYVKSLGPRIFVLLLLYMQVRAKADHNDLSIGFRSILPNNCCLMTLWWVMSGHIQQASSHKLHSHEMSCQTHLEGDLYPACCLSDDSAMLALQTSGVHTHVKPLESLQRECFAVVSHDSAARYCFDNSSLAVVAIAARLAVVYPLVHRD